MKSIHEQTALTGIVIAVLIALQPAAAQTGGAMLHTWPDSLILETYAGTVIVDESGARPIYHLDVDGDETADFHLSFGPWWYTPETGAERPADGDFITVLAAEWDGVLPNTLMVFEIDGLVWREPVAYGQHGWNELPVWEPSVPLVALTGTVLVDTTYFYTHYFLDTDGDEFADYKLGFGPPWYEPASGAVRPDEGDEVAVTGRIHYTDGIDILAVFEIDGLVWRDLQTPAPWAGQWLRRNTAQHTFAYARNDSASWLDFPPGGMMHGNGGNGMGNYPWPDSAFVEFWQIHPDSLPGLQNQEQHRFRFTAHYVNIHDPQGNGMMNGRYGGETGRIRFGEQIRLRLRYNERERERLRLHQDSIRVHAWNREMNQWQYVENIAVDADARVVTFESADVFSYYAISATVISTASEPDDELPTTYVLGQNYPNPFNPATTIPFDLPKAQQITLTVHDALGRTVAIITDGFMPAGTHSVRFDATGFPSGVYLYRLRGDGWTNTRQMTLLR